MMPATAALIPLAVIAGFIALVLLWPRLRSGPFGARLAAEIVVSTMAIFALLVGLIAATQRLPW